MAARAVRSMLRAISKSPDQRVYASSRMRKSDVESAEP